MLVYAEANRVTSHQFEILGAGDQIPQVGVWTETAPAAITVSNVAPDRFTLHVRRHDGGSGPVDVRGFAVVDGRPLEVRPEHPFVGEEPQPEPEPERSAVEDQYWMFDAPEKAIAGFLHARSVEDGDDTAVRMLRWLHDTKDGAVGCDYFGVEVGEPLRLLALPYAGHPDYLPEWAPPAD